MNEWVVLDGSPGPRFGMSVVHESKPKSVHNRSMNVFNVYFVFAAAPPSSSVEP